MCVCARACVRACVRVSKRFTHGKRVSKKKTTKNNCICFQLVTVSDAFVHNPMFLEKQSSKPEVPCISFCVALPLEREVLTALPAEASTCLCGLGNSLHSSLPEPTSLCVPDLCCFVYFPSGGVFFMTRRQLRKVAFFGYTWEKMKCLCKTNARCSIQPLLQNPNLYSDVNFPDSMLVQGHQVELEKVSKDQRISSTDFWEIHLEGTFYL